MHCADGICVRPILVRLGFCRFLEIFVPNARSFEYLH
jgi:hypothetical protein